jgi:site-specific DNA-methyltransferase (adenine-specific)
MIYMKTNFFYFLLSIAKLSHNTSKKDFAFIPLLDFSKKWTDKELNTKFDLSPDDVSLISKYSPKGNDK